MQKRKTDGAKGKKRRRATDGAVVEKNEQDVGTEMDVRVVPDGTLLEDDEMGFESGGSVGKEVSECDGSGSDEGGSQGEVCVEATSKAKGGDEAKGLKLVEEGKEDDEGKENGKAEQTTDSTSNDTQAVTGKAGAAQTAAHADVRKKKRRGVVYLSRVPPGLDITALRSLLACISMPTNIWLRPHEGRKARSHAAKFRDGWIEFGTRRDARRVVSMLNGSAMRGKKRSGRWGNDTWCMKYLEGFEWGMLRDVWGRERVLRVREEVRKARFEGGWVESRVALGRKIGEGRVVRTFKQRGVVEDSDDVRAREAGERVDAGAGGAVDAELMGMMFKRRRVED